MFSTAGFRATIVGILLTSAASALAQATPPEATLFRIFLVDGSTLVSYGEYARVADRVVLSLPLGGTPASPHLQLLSIPSSSVDWDRTDAYADAARAARFAATRGPDEYALLQQAVSRALSDIAVTPSADRKLSMAMEARQNVTRWVAEHFGYRAKDVAQLASLFDGVIGDLRAATGAKNTNFALVANMAAPPDVPLMNAPDLQESTEQAFKAAQLTTDPSERTSLLRAIADSLSGAGDGDDAAWIAPFKARVSTALVTEERINKSYATLTTSLVGEADRYARSANVKAVLSVQERALHEDERLGHLRPQEMAALMASLDVKLDGARRLRLARDQWAARLEILQEFETAVAGPAAMLRACRSRLEAIRQLETTPRRNLIWLEGQTSIVTRLLAEIKAPIGGENALGLLSSATQLASRAVASRQQAVSSGDMHPAWEAASAAAGALMLIDRASEELQRLIKVPEPK
ncbi:MAG TPA: hypothetical protein VH458_23330 [Vicinamibacterales bacterium]